MSTVSKKTEHGTQNTDKRNIEDSLGSGFWALGSGKKSKLKLSKLRRFILFGIIALFLLQFFRIKFLAGGLTGSLALWSVNFIDLFAYLESFAASKSFTMQAMLAVLPVIGIYLIFGRAFCGWVCPMDFLFELINIRKVRGERSGVGKFPPVTYSLQKGSKREFYNFGYVIAGALLLLSALLGIPFFTRYLSHLTNFFSLINSGVYLALSLPVSKTVLIFSGAVMFFLSALEYLSPRLWCKVLCPVGKTYGLFNKTSLLKLSFKEGDCGECNLCEQLCYMDVKITHHLDQPGLRDTNCIYCGRCVEGCGTKGKLVRMKFK